ncbi:MAG: SMC-Scp complex subunit ScpB [Candidatus Pacebacteria bacterium]|nr:SMC-Scp complex subunit ScpB [Candidatus Paceibacterota bacterium]
MELSRQIEALLFYKGEPVTVAFLAKSLGTSEENARQGLATLEQELSGRGIVLQQNGEEYTLGTAPQMGPTIEALLKEELTKELGKAGLETLATVLYRGPILRSEINYLRGVNSNYILRNLLIRGLIEKVDQGGRSTAYKPTFELLSYLGISRVEDLPGYEEAQKSVEEFKESSKESDAEMDEPEVALEESETVVAEVSEEEGTEVADDTEHVNEAS